MGDLVNREHIEICELLEERKGSDVRGTSITLDNLLKKYSG